MEEAEEDGWMDGMRRLDRSGPENSRNDKTSRNRGQRAYVLAHWQKHYSDTVPSAGISSSHAMPPRP
jgi:hypothetical protein